MQRITDFEIIVQWPNFNKPMTYETLTAKIDKNAENEMTSEGKSSHKTACKI